MTSEGTPKQPEFSTAQEMYNYLYSQAYAIASELQGKPIEREQGSIDELLSVNASRESCTFIFTTTKLNISKVDEPEGAYPNTFSFAFAPDILSIDYMEAVPPRPARLKVDVSEIQDKQAFTRTVKPFFEKLNLLFEYFHVPSRVNIPQN